MRVISLCVDGIHQAAQRGLFDWVNEQDAEIICLQDTRAFEYELDHPTFHPEGYFSFFFDSQVPHENGVAIYTRRQPKAVMTGLGLVSGVDLNGRYMQADFDRVSIGCLLAPAASLDDPDSLELKQRFFDEFQGHLNKVTKKRRQYIIAGNFQLAPEPKDVAHFDAHQGESGCLPWEQQWWHQVTKQIGYVDAFRRVSQDPDEYSWWPSGAVDQGDGWRVDHQLISGSLRGTIEHGAYYKYQAFSSHRALIMDYDIPEL